MQRHEPGPTIPSPIDPSSIDRLVDGVLSESDRRTFLARLDAAPDGWRRCALAFLEAQCWRQALVVPESHGSRPSSTESPGFSQPVYRIAMIALASAVVGIAFVLGRAVGESGRTVVEPPITVDVAPGRSSRSGAAPKDFGTTPRSPGDSVAASDPIVEDPGGAAVYAVGVVQIPHAAGPGEEPLSLPILAGPGLDERWLRQQPPFVPESFRRRWEDRGYRVDQQRRLVSVQVDDRGRYLAIPVDEVNLDYVGPATY